MASSAPAAVFSEDRRYRYALWRDTGALGGEGTVLFVGLNPSTAGETEDDPTIRRCVRFARDWGFARLVMANLYAFRATDPRALYPSDRAIDPVGPDNDEWIARLADPIARHVAAWGALGHGTEREAKVLELLGGGGQEVVCLGTTKDGAPRHPLYVRASVRPQPFRRLVEAVL